MLRAPKFLEEEHSELMNALRKASKSSDETGRAVRRLLEKLEPHFEAEERFVTPCLAALTPLAEGNMTVSSQILPLLTELEKRYSAFYEEHKVIRERALAVRKVAARDGCSDIVDLIDGLTHHADVEEELLYPAALVSGRYVAAMSLKTEAHMPTRAP